MFESWKEDIWVDAQERPLAPEYEEQSLMLQNSLYSVTAVYFQANSQKPNGERMEQQQQCHNCRKEWMIHITNNALNYRKSSSSDREKRICDLTEKSFTWNTP